jgi:hypothetical protein
VEAGAPAPRCGKTRPATRVFEQGPERRANGDVVAASAVHFCVPGVEIGNVGVFGMRPHRGAVDVDEIDRPTGTRELDEMGDDRSWPPLWARTWRHITTS